MKRRSAASLSIAVMLIAFTAAVSCACSAASQDRVQYVGNPSFDPSADGRPAGWVERTGDGKARFVLGSGAAVISSEDGADASLVTVAAIDPYCRYRLSGRIKTEALETAGGRGAFLSVGGIREGRTVPKTGTSDWTRVEVEFDAGANDALEVSCVFGGWGKAKGKASFDDVELTRLTDKKVLAPAVSIDALKTGRPMSKYIYGQFIEHLGHCIYQGLWAEMLEDRKFFLPVGGQGSPWSVTGGLAVAAMDRKRPYVGAQSPSVRVYGKGTAGLVQRGLALETGRAYKGRVVLSGDAGAFPVMVSVVWGPGQADRWSAEFGPAAAGYAVRSFEFTAGGTTEDGRFEITSSGRGRFSIGTASLMPADNVRGFRREVVALLKELDAPVYRWPGGNFVSGYDWRDGIGDRDRRPPRKNPAWQGIEHNDVGIHEFLDLMELVGAEPYITVNSGLGDVKMAADEVAYVNGPAGSKMGALRARNGHPEPWKVAFWSIGNEMYGDWQLGHMPLSDYVAKHKAFAAAMRAVDPSIRLVAVGAVGEWSRTMLGEAAPAMDLISEHFYCGERPGLLSHVNQIPAAVKRIADAHREYRASIPALKDAPVPVALDEWNYWYGPEIYGEIGTQYFLKDALGIAAGLNEFARQTDVFFMANYAQTVNVIGAIKTSKTEAVLDTTGLVLMLYRRHFGTIPAAVTGAPEPLDVMACLKEDGKTLTLSVVNPTDREMPLALDFPGLRTAARADLYVITGDGPMACNAPGRPAGVVMRETKGVEFGNRLTVPPMSVSLYEIDIEK